MFKSIPFGSPIHLVYNIKPLGLLVLLVYDMNNRSMSSMIICHILTNIVLKPLGLLVLLVYNMNNRSMSSMIKCCIVRTIVSMSKSIPLGSPIPLVYNIKPLGLLLFLVYSMNNRSISSMIKCHIVTSIVSIWKLPMANHGHSWFNVALWQQLSQCLNQFPWVHQFLWFIILNPWVY